MNKLIHLFLTCGGLTLFAPVEAGEPSVGIDRSKKLAEKEWIALGKSSTVAIEVRGQDREGVWISHGAGTILHESGFILTCEHVTVSGESQIVILPDGTRLPFQVLARAGGTHDTAILKITPPAKAKLSTVVLGHSTNVNQGDRVLIVGNPGGKQNSCVFGVVDKPICGGNTQIQVIEADIEPGYSGGPIFNDRGEQVALVHTKITTAKNTSRNIRVDHIRAAFDGPFQQQASARFTLGIEVDCQADRAVVARVRKGSPAEKAGVLVGDAVTRVGPLEVRDGCHYVLSGLVTTGVKPVSMVLQRGGKPIGMEITPEKIEVRK